MCIVLVIDYVRKKLQIIVLCQMSVKDWMGRPGDIEIDEE